MKTKKSIKKEIAPGEFVPRYEGGDADFSRMLLRMGFSPDLISDYFENYVPYYEGDDADFSRMLLRMGFSPDLISDYFENGDETIHAIEWHHKILKKWLTEAIGEQDRLLYHVWRLFFIMHKDSITTEEVRAFLPDPF